MSLLSLPSRVFYGWWVVASLATLMFLSAGLGFYSLGVFVTPFEDEFGWSRGQVSVGIALATTVSGLCGPFVGMLVQRLGARVVLAVGTAGMGICFASLGFTWILLYLYSMFVIMAVFRAGIMLVPVSFVVANWFREKRGLAIGVATTGIGFGGLVMAPVTALLISAVGWRGTFFASGALITLVGLPLTLLVIRQEPSERGLFPDGLDSPAMPSFTEPSAADRAQPEPGDWPLADAVRTKTFLLIAMALGLGFASVGAVLLHTVPFLEDRGISREQAGLVLGFVSGMGVLGKVASGYLSDRTSPRLVLAGIFLMEAVGLTVLIGTGDMAGVGAFTLVFGFSMGGVVALQPLVVIQYFGIASLAPIVGALTASTAFFSALGPIFAGYMHDLLGNYTLAFLIFIAIDCLAAALVIMLGSPSVRQRPAVGPVEAPTALP